VLLLAIALGGCAKVKQPDPQATVRARAEAKRQKATCASSTAYDRLKGILFDRAVADHVGDRGDLDTLADYSIARMEDPVVKGWDPALDITRCQGRFILQIPPGAERAFGGEHRLQADIDYTAQAAADGSGFVYKLTGAEPIVAKLAAFNLTSRAYRPPAAIDDPQIEPREAGNGEALPAEVPVAAARSEPPAEQGPISPSDQRAFTPERPSEMAASAADDTGEATVRAFYSALRAGDGEAASARIVPEKQVSGAFSPEAISSFYGRLPDPIRLTDIVSLGRGAYRVRYRYSAGRSHCDGSAVVSLTRRSGRTFIRSIRALSGC
jgi:hypothetical protein